MITTQQKRLLSVYEAQLQALTKAVIRSSAKARRKKAPVIDLLDVAAKARALLSECVGLACWASTMAGQESSGSDL